MNVQPAHPMMAIHMPALYAFVELITVSSLLASFVLVIRAWSRLPEQFPTHFGFSGEPDQWDSKSFALGMPIFGLVLWAGITILCKYLANYPVPITQANAAYQYGLMLWMIAFLKLELVWVFTYITWKEIQVALGKATGIGIWLLPVSLAAFAATIVYYVLATRSG